MSTVAVGRTEVLGWLGAEGTALDELYARADAVRAAQFGDVVRVRAILEISNVCRNDCLYCGIRAGMDGLRRYRMSEADVLDAIDAIAADGVADTVVLQAGETATAEFDAWVERVVARSKERHPSLAVTLSLGNRSKAVYARWRAAGMDRYLLRFETSDEKLFATLHPGSTLDERLECLAALREVGAEVGTGFMTGLPGATAETEADNLLLCRSIGPAMIGIGPFLPQAGTPLADARPPHFTQGPDAFFRSLAALRILHPTANIPATTALDALMGGGRDLAFSRGANVFMYNATPTAFRSAYQLYPGKPGVDARAEDAAAETVARLARLGRKVSRG